MKKNENSDGSSRRRQHASSSAAAAALQNQGLSAGVLTFASFSGGVGNAVVSPPLSPADPELRDVSSNLDPNVLLLLKQVVD